MISELLAYFTRGRRSGSQIGVFATPEGVAAAEVTQRAKGKPRLDRCVYEKQDNHDPFARALERLPSRRAPTVCVLDPGGYRLLLVEAPDVPPDELRAAVRWRVKDLIDFHVDDAVIDVFEMPPHARGGPRRMMYAVTAKAELVKQEIERIEGAGLKLDVVDIPELSLRNIAMLLESDRGAAFLYLSERRSTLLLVRQGVLYLARYIETGVATLADAGEMRPDLVAGLALEVRRSLDYFESHYEQTSIQQLHVSGLEPADREAIALELGLAVREVDLTTLFETDDVLSPEVQRLCMPAIGAALRKDPSRCSAMYQQINLYQPIFRKQRQIFSAATMLQGLGAVTAALIAIYGYGLLKVGSLEAEVVLLEGREQALMTQLTRIDPSVSASRRAELETELRRLNATLAGQQRLIDVLREQPLGRTEGFSAYLAALARQRTPELWLTSLAVNGGNGAIELKGRSLRPELVPEYMQRLGAEAALAGQRFDQFEIERDEESGEATFRATSRAALTLADGSIEQPP